MNSTQIKCNLPRFFFHKRNSRHFIDVFAERVFTPTREKKSEKERRGVQEKEGRTENKEERRKHEGLRKLPTRLLVTTLDKTRIELKGLSP